MNAITDSAEFVAPDPAQLAPLFPGYEIEGLIATGGMGAVYRAVQRSLDRTVAIKILPRELSSDASFCAGFEAEAKAMARLNHPNLIGVYDFGEVDGMLFIVMEYVPGQSLHHSAHGLAIDPQESARLVTAICQGLAHAHENGILHRDIKPANILLDLQAQPKIGDFGLARPADRQVEHGEEIFGTPHYTAPEVVASPFSVDLRADVFSVGVILHELLTGKLPASDPRTASQISGCDARFDAIIRRATNPVVGARYASAAEMAADLQAIQAPSLTGSSPRRPMPPPKVPTARKTYAVKKKSSPVGTLLFFGLLAAAGAGAAYLLLTGTPLTWEAISVKFSGASAASEQQEAAPEQSWRPSGPKETAPAPVRETPRAAPPKDTAFGSTEPPSGIVPPGKTTAFGTLIDEAPAPPAPSIPPVPAQLESFFARAHQVMRERSAPQLQAYNASVDAGSSSAESNFQQGIRPLVGVYVTGLEKQIERESDPEVVAFLREEIQRAESSAYFAELLKQPSR